MSKHLDSAAVRITALLVAGLGLLYVPTFFFTAVMEHGHEQVSWASARVIAGESVLPTLMTAGVFAVVGSLIALAVWAWES